MLFRLHSVLLCLFSVLSLISMRIALPHILNVCCKQCVDDVLYLVFAEYQLSIL